jgi:hypothetical protein
MAKKKAAKKKKKYRSLRHRWGVAASHQSPIGRGQRPLPIVLK